MANEKLDILLGFENDKVKEILENNLKKNGCEITRIACRTSKKAVREYVQKNPTCNVVVLRETIGTDKYKYADEVTCLTDSRDINVIFVISERHAGTDYVVKLLNAGITGVLFQVGRGGVSVKEICEQIVKPRTRKEARDYYGIEGKDIAESAVFGSEVDRSMELYSAFINGSGNTLENFMLVCSEENLTMPEIAGFIRKLPEDAKMELSQYDEFHKVLDFLRVGGFDMKIKKPKRLLVGLKPEMEVEIDANGVRLKDRNANEDSNEENFDDIDFDSLSMEDLFDNAMVNQTSENSVDENFVDEVAEEEVMDESLEDALRKAMEEEDKEDEEDEEQGPSQKELKALEKQRKEQEREEERRKIAEQKAQQLKEKEERRRQMEAEREIALQKKKEADAERAVEREEEKAKRKEAFDEKKAQLLGNVKAFGAKMKEEREERALQREKALKEREEKSQKQEFIWDDDDEDFMFDAGGVNIRFGVFIIICVIVLVALIGVVGWLSMGHSLNEIFVLFLGNFLPKK